MKSIQQSLKQSRDSQKIVRIDKSIEYASYLPKIEEIKKFEPKLPGHNMTLLNQEDYDYTIEVAEKFLKSKKGRAPHSNKYKSYLIFEKYEDVLKMIANTKQYNYIFFDNNVYYFKSQSHKDLLTILYTDINLEYLKLYEECLSENLSPQEIHDKFINKYGFYSYKLIYMELQTVKLLNKLTEKRSR